MISIDRVKYIKASGGRFLSPRKDGQGWNVLEDMKARDKVSGLFRYKARMLKKEKEENFGGGGVYNGKKRKSSTPGPNF